MLTVSHINFVNNINTILKNGIYLFIISLPGKDEYNIKGKPAQGAIQQDT